MNSKALKILEYNKILEQLASFASTDLGAERCLNLVPDDNMDNILKNLQETDDALQRLWHNGRISFGGVKNIAASVKRLEVGSNLSATELLDISSTLDVALRVKAFARDYRDGHDTDDEFIDSLDERFSMLEPLSPLNTNIKRCIVSPDEIADDASSELRSIRRSIRNTGEKIRSQMNSMVNSPTTRTYLQEYVITQRDGRYCLPVKAEYRSNVPGMIHDQSSSGSTLFIEPMVVVSLNNDLKTLAIKEQEEIERILAELSSEAAGFVTELHDDLQILTDLDFIFAKASFSKSYNGSKPAYNCDGKINIKKGRHPLLDSKKVVPIDIYIGDTFDQLIITGPNTGGKTVSLKTVGLFTLMGQSGLLIPADDSSMLSVFTEVYADIGDEQSIEQNLSTFSSHMKNIINIVEKADKDSLVLFDEICAGTDPIEGAALAISILSFLHRMKIRTIATTHYSELKVYALKEDGIENACCEFSVETLSPTYKLLIGIPGKSNAFAIAGKLGLPEFIIDEARLSIDSEQKSFEDLLSELENSRTSLEKERLELSGIKAETERTRDEYKKKSQQIDDRRERIIREANEEAQEILQEAKSFADETIRKVNKLGSSAKDLEKERHKVREKLNEHADKASKELKKTPSKVYKPKDFKIGDDVKVLSLNLNGTVSSLPNDKGDMYVQMGILRSLINIRDVELIDTVTITAPSLTKTGSGKIKFSKSASVSTEINLIGCTVDEAIAKLDKYLDDAYLAHMPSVRVVHGRGTGALKNAVWQHLKRLKYVASYRLGEFGEGSDGVTVVEFK